MADWAPCYHFFHIRDVRNANALEARIASAAHKQHQGDRWAARIGYPGGQLLQVQTAIPWGHLVLGADVEVCPAYDFLSSTASKPDSFFAGFNYLFSTEGLDLTETARLLGPNCRAQAHARRSILALERAIPLKHATQENQLSATLEDSTDLARLVEALALGAESSLAVQSTTLVLGLRTTEHGYVHIGHLRASLRSVRHGSFQFHVTGQHNSLINVRDIGPSTFALTKDDPAPKLSAEHWPTSASSSDR
jgi:hypothetical protein